jgi:aspartyl-tRNA(Asn)/glutamyl-tRNA(Gln) amidotransferase subunit B
MINSDFETVIGLEIHAQIAVKSKMFCSCSSNSFNKEPNINTCPICMGFPGQLPVINETALNKGVLAGLALNCVIPAKSKFDRKNYFYPDLPKGFQISQFDQPIAKDGYIEIVVKDEKKRIGITRLHLEDDAGKLTHVENGTLCDYNRSGIPLMEIVSEPDLRSAEEAEQYAKMMQTLLRFVGASEADMEKGMMRFDASVSIRPNGDNKLYPRAEIKNLNSFRSLVSAIEYEVERQMFLWEKGEPQSGDVTVGWSDDHKKTYFLRDKEAAHDYRYFPEPDLPPVVIADELIEKLRNELPEMPADKRARYINEMKISETEAELISSDVDLSAFYERVENLSGDTKKATTFVATILMAHLNKTGKSVNEIKFSADDLADLIKLINEDTLSMNMAKGEVFDIMFEKGQSPKEIIIEKGLTQVSDTGEIESICKRIIQNNGQSVADYLNGKSQAFSFLIGQVMKETKGRANPQIVNETLKKLIHN